MQMHQQRSAPTPKPGIPSALMSKYPACNHLSLLFFLRVPLSISPHLLLLLLPVASFLVVLADAQRTPEPIVLLDLRLGQFMHLVHFQTLLRRGPIPPLTLPRQLPSQGFGLVFDLVFIDTIIRVISIELTAFPQLGYAPLILQQIPQLKDLKLNLTLPIVLQDILIRLPLAVLQAVQVSGVGFAVVARLEVRQVALDIAGRATSSRGIKTNVGRHSWEDRCVVKIWKLKNYRCLRRTVLEVLWARV